MTVTFLWIRNDRPLLVPAIAQYLTKAGCMASNMILWGSHIQRDSPCFNMVFLTISPCLIDEETYKRNKELYYNLAIRVLLRYVQQFAVVPFNYYDNLLLSDMAIETPERTHENIIILTII
ncbi:uncharacterized protein ARMOST_08372 [Armillaria ostoyae]|uniref:Uncharacterized protein n=1 Tax=Armillaria ostoyae TaxID=47428 RepID=A0A284R8E0_ARMOS|nr:uncharacterized protein ARMOST_08372 [Armillaria ostoyae]